MKAAAQEVQRATRTRYRVMTQGGFEKMAPDPSAFLTLPRNLVEHVGIRTHMGARLDLALLAGFAYHYKQNKDSEKKKIVYHDGDEVEFGQQVFVVSMQTVAEDLYVRWFGQLAGDQVLEDFSRFYERCKKSIYRLMKEGLLHKLNYVNGTDGTKGTYWTLDSTPLMYAVDAAEQVPASGLLLTQTSGIEIPESEYVNVVDLIGSVFLSDVLDDYTLSEISTHISPNDFGKTDRGRTHDWMEWTSFIAANGAKGDRHISVGAFKPGHEHRYERPWFIPWYVFDVDRDDIIEAHRAARQIVEDLVYMGADPRKFLVCPTGGDGYHVTVPSGMFGSPIFASAMKAEKTLRRFATLFLEERVDTNLFNPSHLVRMIGSQHQATGRYKTAITAEHFMKMSVEDTVLYSSKLRKMKAMPDPRTFPPVSNMVLGMAYAGDLASGFNVPAYHDVQAYGEGNSEALDAAMAGVEEGEVWYTRHDGKEYIGRNWQIHYISYVLLNRGEDERDVWKTILEVNQRNSPPLPEHTLKSPFNSARRKVLGAGRTR